MNSLRRHIWVFLCVLFLLTACGNNDILSVNQMVDVLFDIYRLNGALSQQYRPLTSEQKVLYYENVFARHNTSKEQFDRSLRWYADHPSSWSQVYELLEKRGEQYADSVKNKELPQLQERQNSPSQNCKARKAVHLQQNNM